MSTEQNKLAAIRLLERGLSQRNLAEIDIFFGRDLVDHALPPDLPPGLAGRRLFAAAFFEAFPDIQVRADDVLAEDDRLVTRWTATGTHRGYLMGIPPTGKTVRITGIAFDRMAGGQSVEHWEVLDQLGLMQQLGVIPAAA